MDTSFITINAHSSIRIDAGEGAVVYVDPFRLTDEPHDADLVLVTHSHYDHFSPEDIARIEKDSTVFVAPASMADELPGALLVSPGEACEPIPGLRVEAVPAYNLNKQFHPKANQWVGYVVTTLGGTRVYVAGDTDDLDENRSIACDVALVPVGGTYTMDAPEAAAFVNAMRPAVAIPEHYGSVTGTPEDGETFKGLVDPGIEVVIKL